MTWYPGWDSLDSVRTWHTVFEVSGIAFLALLVGAEIFAFQYGHRKDELTTIAESSAAAERKRDVDEAEARRKNEVDGLQNQLTDANKKVAKLEQQAAPRVLTQEQERVIFDAISPFRGTKIDVVAPIGQGEARAFAIQLIALLRKAGWDAGPNDGLNLAEYSGPTQYGIQITINGPDGRRGQLPPGADALIGTLVKLGLSKGGFLADAVPSGKIEMRVGPKEPT